MPRLDHKRASKGVDASGHQPGLGARRRLSSDQFHDVASELLQEAQHLALWPTRACATAASARATGPA